MKMKSSSQAAVCTWARASYGQVTTLQVPPSRTLSSSERETMNFARAQLEASAICAPQREGQVKGTSSDDAGADGTLALRDTVIAARVVAKYCQRRATVTCMAPRVRLAESYRIEDAKGGTHGFLQLGFSKF
jgi:hypothetical protein